MQDPRRSCLAVAVRRDGVPRLRAPHRAVAAGRRGEPPRAAAARRPGRARLPQGARARARVPRAPARAGALRRLDRARGRLGARPRGDARGDARRRRRRLPGGTHRGRLARCRGLPDPGGDAVGARRVVATRRSTRSSRGTRSPPTSCSSASTASGSRALQGVAPERIHVLLGNQTMESFRPQEFAAYQRRVERRLEGFVADPPPTEPFPVDRCGICEFKPRCDAHWDAVDHLCRVAGIQRRQIERLEETGVATLAALARADDEARPAGMADETFAKLRDQARAAAGRARARTRRVRAPPARRPPPGSRCCPILRRATSSSTSRATRSGITRAASSTSGARPTRTTSSPCAGRPTTTRSGRPSRRSSTSCTRGSRSTPTCTSTTTRSTRSRRCGG